MKKSSIKKAVILILSLTMLLNTSGPVFADDFSFDDQEPKPIDMETMELLDSYVSISDNQFTLTVPMGISNKIDSQELNEITSQIQEINKIIKQNNLVIDETGAATMTISDEELRTILKDSGIQDNIPKTGTETPSFSDNQLGTTLQTFGNQDLSAKIIGGITTVKFYWWGFDLFLSSDMVRLCAKIGATAVGQLIGARFGSAVGKAIGAVARIIVDRQWNAKIIRKYWWIQIPSVRNQ